MKTKSDKRIQGLLDYAERTKNETENKVYKTIDYMLKKGDIEINFQTVSRMSGISRTTLYNNESIRQRINKLRLSDNVSRVEIDKTRKEIDNLKKELERLMRENKLMADQLVRMDDIKRENDRLKRLLEEKR